MLIFGRQNVCKGLGCCNIALYVEYFVNSYKKLLGFFPLYPNSQLNSLLITWCHTICWRRTCSSKGLFSYSSSFYCLAISGSGGLHFSQEGSKPLFSVLLSSWSSTILQKYSCGQCLWRHIKRKFCGMLNVWGRTQLSSAEWKEIPAIRWVYF